MCLRLVYLIITRVFSWLRLSRRDEAWKSAEILLLRHQLTVRQRQTPARPKMTWADRALIAALVELIPRRRHASLRLSIADIVPVFISLRYASVRMSMLVSTLATSSSFWCCATDSAIRFTSCNCFEIACNCI